MSKTHKPWKKPTPVSLRPLGMVPQVEFAFSGPDVPLQDQASQLG
jgi:hypothetical protein